MTRRMVAHFYYHGDFKLDNSDTFTRAVDNLCHHGCLQCMVTMVSCMARRMVTMVSCMARPMGTMETYMARRMINKKPYLAQHRN